MEAVRDRNDNLSTNDLGLIANDKPFEEIYREARIDEKIRGGTYSF